MGSLFISMHVPLLFKVFHQGKIYEKDMDCQSFTAKEETKEELYFDLKIKNIPTVFSEKIARYDLIFS